MTASGRGWVRPGWTAPFPLAVLGIGAALSLLAFRIFSDAIETEARLRFEREASDAGHIIERRTFSYVEIIRGLRALFATRESVGREEFHRFVSSLDLARNFPGFEVLNYAAHVPAARRKGFEDAVRRDRSLRASGYPEFDIRPPGERASYEVLVYLEPLEGNEAAFGLDLAANPRVAEAVGAGRDSGELTTSGRLILTKGDPGLAMRLAVYGNGMPIGSIDERRAAFRGSVGAGFNVRNLMRGALGSSSPGYLRYRLHDVGPAGGPLTGPSADSLLFDSEGRAGTSAGPVNEEDQFRAALSMQIGGRVWELRFRARRDEVLGRLQLLLPWLVLLGGTAASLVLSGMLGSVVASRGRALRLAEEIQQRTRELEEALSELESFSYSVSHDLRAPLRHMSGFAGLLRERWQQLDAATAERYLAGISEAAVKMGELIDDLLALSRASRASLTLESLELGPLVEDVRRECLREAGGRNLEWRIASLPAVEADPALLRVALVNLVGNAVKFTARRELALIEIGSAAGAAAEAVVYVRDNGAGFEMRHASKLFGVFQRLHSDADYPGTGIGLATVRRIVERHGGKAWAEAAPDRGATFYFSLRRARGA